jgi:hypothetical protein
MNPNSSDDFLNRELDNLRVQTGEVTTPPAVEDAVLRAFVNHQCTQANARPNTNASANPKRRQAWLTALSQWFAPVTALAASVVMGIWVSLSLLLPTGHIPPVEITDATSQIDNTGRDNSAPFFALQSLEQISLEPNPRLIETQIPKMMLTSMGVTVPPEMAAESLRAEMLVSAAGQPLALRFSQR